MTSHEVRNWKEIVRRATKELKRAQRRDEREKVIAKRLKVRKAFKSEPDQPGVLHSKSGMGNCGNRSCMICAVNRQDKRDNVKAERTKGHHEERL